MYTYIIYLIYFYYYQCSIAGSNVLSVMSMFNIHFVKELYNLYIANFTRFFYHSVSLLYIIIIITVTIILISIRKFTCMYTPVNGTAVPDLMVSK